MGKTSKRNLTGEQCKAIVSQLLDWSYFVDGQRKLPRGATKDVAGKFGVTPQTVTRLWRKALGTRTSLGGSIDTST